ncbi:lipid-A-disaccharide synthase [candidate division KSB1 bacterium]|nr:lipid-A-disaccharide synthase [candidate division KSB1 bacterium]
MSTKIMILAGEASGDLHGGELVKELFKAEPNLEIFGVGGDKMRQAGMELYYHVDQLAYIGFWEVIKHYFYFRRIFFHLLEELDKRRPDIVVLIDYPGFNLKFARQAHKKGVNIFYFIAPQVWAWAQGRAKKMAKYIHHLAVIFDFEVPFFKKYGIKTTFVGHPLMDGLKTTMDKQTFCQHFDMNPDTPLLALLPGSRKQEIEFLLPVMLKAATALKKQHGDLQIAVSKAATIREENFNSYLKEFPDVRIIENKTYDLMKHATAAFVASGTATLETACFETPFVIAYRVSPLSYLIGKMLVKIHHIGLANIVAGELVAKEYIQQGLTVENVKPELEKLLYDTNYRVTRINKLKKVKQKLGAPGAAGKTALLILDQLKTNRT